MLSPQKKRGNTSTQTNSHHFWGSSFVSFSEGVNSPNMLRVYCISPTFGHFPGVLEEEVDALDFAHNVLGLAEAEPDESQAWTWTNVVVGEGCKVGPKVTSCKYSY